VTSCYIFCSKQGESITVCAETHRFIFLVIRFIHFGVGSRTCNWHAKEGNFLNVLDFIRIWFMPTPQYITIQGSTYYIMIIYYKILALFIFKVVFLNTNEKNNYLWKSRHFKANAHSLPSLQLSTYNYENRTQPPATTRAKRHR
jgi:hypothetical protein